MKGDKHNDVDISQRHAAELERWEEIPATVLEQAERQAKSLEREWFKYRTWKPGEREELVRSIAEDIMATYDENGYLRGENYQRPKYFVRGEQVGQEEEEQPFDQNEFFSDIENLRKQIPKKL